MLSIDMALTLTDSGFEEHKQGRNCASMGESQHDLSPLVDACRNHHSEQESLGG